MPIESGSWKIDLHSHAGDADARRNIPPLTYPRKRQLLEAGEINADMSLAHETFPERLVDESRRLFKDTPVMIGIEISSRVPNDLREKPSRIPRMVHVNGLFEEKPRDWPFPELEWEKSYLKRWKQVATLPSIKDVLEAIKDLGGVAVIPHPSPRRIPWASLWLSEAEHLVREGVITPDVAIELNGHWLYRGTNKDVKEFADKHGLAIVGGSDAHTPETIERFGTIFPKYSGNIFKDLKTAIAERKTQVKDNVSGFGVIYESGVAQAV